MIGRVMIRGGEGESKKIYIKEPRKPRETWRNSNSVVAVWLIRILDVSGADEEENGRAGKSAASVN